MGEGGHAPVHAIFNLAGDGGGGRGTPCNETIPYTRGERPCLARSWIPAGIAWGSYHFQAHLVSCHIIPCVWRSEGPKPYPLRIISSWFCFVCHSFGPAYNTHPHPHPHACAHPHSHAHTRAPAPAPARARACAHAQTHTETFSRHGTRVRMHACMHACLCTCLHACLLVCLLRACM